MKVHKFSAMKTGSLGLFFDSWW